MFNTDAGKRVLSRIAAICDPVPLGPHQCELGPLAFKEGMRFVMHQMNLSFAGRGAPGVKEQE